MMWLMPLLLITLGLIACLVLFLSLKNDLLVRARRSEKHIESLLQRLHEASILSAERLAAPTEVFAKAPEMIYAPLRSGMNVSRRKEALRLLRRGEDIGHVAAALAAPRSEIELLIRVQELTGQRVHDATAASG